ncbi:MAG: SDR family NAD(P)-dependent oxidoreductase [Gammaproteobacteria bacterium]|nr:SDR family NAD(P)-dependent oxidoreductase [Gammaproteobacteria bacterium]MBT8134631.1 SDR family NAD(P)-dependent oxidoreductase [Gammaproteobacteria bacterium]NNJ49709.1 SDR family NAD(P)-dependent oxidoreductase [Gammaproteobacteria bacterium]
MQSTDEMINKVILITGASDGIGKATAIECARQGATVIIHGKTVPKLELLYDEIIKAGYTEPVIYPLDLEKVTADDCETLRDVISDEFGKLDGLFNNAGWLGAAMPIQQYDIKLWFQVMQINLNAAFMLTQACLPLLNQKDQSSIVFTLDDKNTAYWGAYGVSKAGLRSMMAILADEVENTSINVTGLIPGTVRTKLRTRAFPAEDPTQLTSPEEVARAAAFLLSNKNDHIGGRSSHGNVFKLEELGAEIT